MQQSQSHRYSTQLRITRLILKLIGLFGLILSLTQHFAFAGALLTAQPNATDAVCYFQIQIIQVVKALPNLEQVPQRGWEVVKLPDDWETRWKNYTGSAWYKIKWQYQCDQENQPVALLIERINIAGAVYSNNELLWKDKSLVEPLSRSWNMPRYWVLPATSIQNHQNEILVRVVGVASQHSGLGKIKFGQAEDIANQQDQLVF